MDFKKQCIQFKKNAKELGYDLKLTHVQELLSKLEGFSNRHAKLAQDSTKAKINKTSSGIKMYINTDDYVFDLFLVISQEYMLWAVDNDRGFIDMMLEGDYGPDIHTDNLLYNIDDPKLNDIKNYLSVMQKANKIVGYSVSIDKDSFVKWKQKNLTLLQDKGFFV